jgi:hypothetical protein
MAGGPQASTPSLPVLAAHDHQFNEEGVPTIMAFHDLRSAVNHRRSVKVQPRRDPEKDPTIANVTLNVEQNVKALMQAFFNTTKIEDSGKTPKIVNQCRRDKPEAYSSIDVEAACRFVHQQLLDHCHDGFTGLPMHDKLGPGQKSMHSISQQIDFDGSCEERFQQVVRTLNAWKSVCNGIMLEEHKIAALVNAPATTYAVKIRERDGNNRRARRKIANKDDQEKCRVAAGSNAPPPVPNRLPAEGTSEQGAAAPQSLQPAQATGGLTPKDLPQGLSSNGNSMAHLPEWKSVTDRGNPSMLDPRYDFPQHMFDENLPGYSPLPYGQQYAPTPYQQVHGEPQGRVPYQPPAIYNYPAIGHETTPQSGFAPLGPANPFGPYARHHQAAPNMHGEGNHANTNMHHRNKYLTTYDIKSRDTHYHLGDPTNFPLPNPFALPTNGIPSTMLSRTSAGMTNNNRAAASKHGYGEANMAGAMVQHPQMRHFPGHPSTQLYPHTGEKRDHDTALPEEPSQPSIRRKGNHNGLSFGYPHGNSYGGGSADTVWKRSLMVWKASSMVRRTSLIVKKTRRTRRTRKTRMRTAVAMLQLANNQHQLVRWLLI